MDQGRDRHGRQPDEDVAVRRRDSDRRSGVAYQSSSNKKSSQRPRQLDDDDVPERTDTYGRSRVAYQTRQYKTSSQPQRPAPRESQNYAITGPRYDTTDSGATVLPSRTRGKDSDGPSYQTRAQPERRNATQGERYSDSPSSTTLFPRRTSSLQTQGSTQIHQGSQSSPTAEDYSPQISGRYGAYNQPIRTHVGRHEADPSYSVDRDKQVLSLKKLSRADAQAVKELCTISADDFKGLRSFLEDFIDEADQSWVEEGLMRVSNLEAADQDRAAKLALRNTTFLHMSLDNRKWRDDIDRVKNGERQKFKKHLDELQVRLKEISSTASHPTRGSATDVAPQTQRHGSPPPLPRGERTRHAEYQDSAAVGRDPEITARHSVHGGQTRRPSETTSMSHAPGMRRMFLPREGVHDATIRSWAKEFLGPNGQVVSGTHEGKSGYFLISRDPPDKHAISSLLADSKRQFLLDREESAARPSLLKGDMKIPVRPMSELLRETTTRPERGQGARRTLRTLREVDFGAVNLAYGGVVDWAELVEDLDANIISHGLFRAIGGSLKPGHGVSYGILPGAFWVGQPVRLDLKWFDGRTFQVPFIVDSEEHDFGLLIGGKFIRQHDILRSRSVAMLNIPAAGITMRIRTYLRTQSATVHRDLRPSQLDDAESEGLYGANSRLEERYALRHVYGAGGIEPKPRTGSPQNPRPGEDLFRG